MIDRLAAYERPQLPLTVRQSPRTPGGPTALQRLESLLGHATNWVVEHPEIALTGAVVTGVVLGWLIKRR